MIVAEVGANHHQSYQRAMALVHVAKEVGADAVKVQMFTPEQMAPDDGVKIKNGPWSGRTLYELYARACMPIDWVPKLLKIAGDIGIKLFASVYHPDMVETAEEMGIPIYKIASFEIAYPELIEKVAATKKPLIISTGSADFREIEQAVKTVKKHHGNLTLLKCTSQYPAPAANMNLRTIPALAHIFGVDAGLSDHTTGIVAPVVAVSLGATVIEKHLTLDREGLDGSFSILPDRFLVMTQTIRTAELVLGKVDYGGEKTYHRKKINGKWVRVVW